jgi:hypothetical protein
MSVPSVPVIVPRALVRTTSATFYWQPPASDGGSAITGYVLECTAASISESLGPSTLSYTVSGLSFGTDYVFTIYATNSNGNSPTAEFRSITPGEVPYGATAATVSTLTTSTALVSWTLSTIPTEARIKWLRLRGYPSSIGMSSFSWATYPYLTEAYRGNLSTNTYYHFTVEAVNDVGYSYPPIETSTIQFGAVAPFDPTTLSGLVTWLDGADAGTITLGGGTVTTWADKSGNGHDATHASGSGPTYSSNGLNFTGQNMPTGTPFSSQITVVLVATQQSGGATYYIRRNGAPADSPSFIANYDGSKLEYFNGADRDTLATSPASLFYTAFTYDQGNQVKGWYNGTNVFTISQTQSGNSPGSFPIILGAPGFDLSARIQEFVVYNRVLTDGEMGQVNSYLSTKWSV